MGKIETIVTPYGPLNCSTLRLFRNTTMWVSHEKKKRAHSRALLGLVVCQNSFSFGPKKNYDPVAGGWNIAMPRALVSGWECFWSQNGSYFYTPKPPKLLHSPPPSKHNNVGST